MAQIKQKQESSYEDVVQDIESITNIEQKELLKRQKEADKLIDKLDSIKKGRDDCFEFQNFCFDLIKTTFKNDLKFEPTKEVQDLEDGKKIKMSRRDIVISNTPLKKDVFWSDLKKRDRERLDPFALGSLSIVFECKNYSDNINGDAVYQTYEYLDPGDRDEHPKGRLAFIITRCGSSPSTNRAIKRVKQDGYYIYIINDNIIKSDWLPKYVENNSVEQFFEEFIKNTTPQMS